MSDVLTHVVIRFVQEGFHRWVNAPELRAYLAQRHRHLFHVEVALQVFDEDREVEFHDLLDFCKAAFPTGDFGGRSCETLAKDLQNTITCRYPNRQVIVSVFEDGEVGARVSGYPPALWQRLPAHVVFRRRSLSSLPDG